MKNITKLQGPVGQVEDVDGEVTFGRGSSGRGREEPGRHAGRVRPDYNREHEEADVQVVAGGAFDFGGSVHGATNKCGVTFSIDVGAVWFAAVCAVRSK